MTNRILFFVFLLSVPMITAAQNAERTMLKSFNLDGKGQLRLELPGTVEVKKWDKPIVQIQITVHLANGNVSMLNELANVGRYNLSSKSEGDALVVSADNLYKIIKIKGQELKENITFQVTVPKDIPVKVFDMMIVASVDKK